MESRCHIIVLLLEGCQETLVQGQDEAAEKAAGERTRPHWRARVGALYGLRWAGEITRLQGPGSGRLRGEGGVQGRGRVKADAAGVRRRRRQAGVTERGRVWCGKISTRKGGSNGGGWRGLGSAATIHRSGFCFVGFSWEPSGPRTNLLHTCPSLPSPVTRLPLCSGRSCRSRAGCCCTAKGTATESCLVAPAVNKGECTGEQKQYT